MLGLSKKSRGSSKKFLCPNISGFLCSVKNSERLQEQNTMKKLSKNISPFLLLAVPFLALLVFLAVHSGNDMVEERAQLTASFFKLPEIDVFQVFFKR